MGSEAINRLLKATRDNPALRDRLSSAPNVEAFVKMAQSYGYHFTIDEWRETKRFSSQELGKPQSRKWD